MSLTSIMLASCTAVAGRDGVVVTVGWGAACVELWDGNELKAISSFASAHVGEWDQPRSDSYFCELALPAPPTITLPPLAPGVYQICDQGRSDCRTVTVPRREA